MDTTDNTKVSEKFQYNLQHFPDPNHPGLAGSGLTEVGVHMVRAIFHWHVGPALFGLVVAKSVCLSVCLSPSHAIFFCVGGLVRSVPRPWTGADCASVKS